MITYIFVILLLWLLIEGHSFVSIVWYKVWKGAEFAFYHDKYLVSDHVVLGGCENPVWTTILSICYFNHYFIKLCDRLVVYNTKLHKMAVAKLFILNL